MKNEPKLPDESVWLSRILLDRGKAHGDWKFNAQVQYDLKSCIATSLMQRREKELPYLSQGQVGAIDAICGKIARIIAGDPNHADHWDDIAGYALLGRDS